MVEADLGVLLDDNSPKRLINHRDPATRRARHTEFVRSVRSTRPYGRSWRRGYTIHIPHQIQTKMTWQAVGSQSQDFTNWFSDPIWHTQSSSRTLCLKMCCPSSERQGPTLYSQMLLLQSKVMDGWTSAWRTQAVRHSSQSHKPGCAGIHTDNNHFQETAAAAKACQHPRPCILNMQGQVARCYAETCFQKFISDDLQRLRGLPKQDLIKEFTNRKLDLRQAFVSTGMGDLQTKTLTLAEAKKRKIDIVLQRRKQQKLLQAEQPKAIECT